VLEKISRGSAIIGFINAGYLTIEKITNNQAMCLPGLGDCWTVANSQYSQIYGIPVAVLGMAAYGLILTLLFVESKFPGNGEFIRMLTFGVVLTGTIYSIYLTYLEIAVIKAVCPFCVISAIAMLVLFFCTLLRLVNNQNEINPQLEEENG
jgi:uncharacterized membrane protein